MHDLLQRSPTPGASVTRWLAAAKSINQPA
jgi:hypothetical protein